MSHYDGSNGDDTVCLRRAPTWCTKTKEKCFTSIPKARQSLHRAQRETSLVNKVFQTSSHNKAEKLLSPSDIIAVVTL